MTVPTPGGGGQLVPIQHLDPGVKIRLRNGAIAIVHENPRDGMWLLVRLLESPSGAVDSEQIEMVTADDVVATVP